MPEMLNLYFGIIILFRQQLNIQYNKNDAAFKDLHAGSVTFKMVDMSFEIELLS